MERLRDEILELIARIKVPKVEIFHRAVNGGVTSLDDILYEPNEIPDTPYWQQLQRFKEIQEERRRVRGARRNVKMYPCGKMVHLVKTGEKKYCMQSLVKCLTCFTTNAGFQYNPIWAGNDDFDEIVVSPTMGHDHYINRIRSMMEKTAGDFGISP
jgi:hypothetical protein